MNGLSDREFHARLDALEQGAELPTTLSLDDRADLALVRRLLKLRSTPSQELVARIQRIAASPSSRSRPVPGWRRTVVTTGIIGSLVLVFTLIFTPVGTWAQGILQLFGITFMPGAMPQWSAGLPETTPTRSPVAFSSEREVMGAVEFPLRWPKVFPFERDGATFLGYLEYTRNGAWIESQYGDARHRYLEVQVFWKLRPGPWPVGDARFEPINVAGYAGLWGEGVPASFIAGARSSLILKKPDGTVTQVGRAESSSLEPINLLLWEEGETLYVLIDPNRQFSQVELLRTAVSAYQDR
jgi:hypothetical protein